MMSVADVSAGGGHLHVSSGDALSARRRALLLVQALTKKTNPDLISVTATRTAGAEAGAQDTPAGVAEDTVGNLKDQVDSLELEKNELERRIETLEEQARGVVGLKKENEELRLDLQNLEECKNEFEHVVLVELEQELDAALAKNKELERKVEDACQEIEEVRGERDDFKSKLKAMKKEKKALAKENRELMAMVATMNATTNGGGGGRRDSDSQSNCHEHDQESRVPTNNAAKDDSDVQTNQSPIVTGESGPTNKSGNLMEQLLMQLVLHHLKGAGDYPPTTSTAPPVSATQPQASGERVATSPQLNNGPAPPLRGQSNITGESLDYREFMRPPDTVPKPTLSTWSGGGVAERFQREVVPLYNEIQKRMFSFAGENGLIKTTTSNPRVTVPDGEYQRTPPEWPHPYGADDNTVYIRQPEGPAGASILGNDFSSQHSNRRLDGEGSPYAVHQPTRTGGPGNTTLQQTHSEQQHYFHNRALSQGRHPNNPSLLNLSGHTSISSQRTFPVAAHAHQSQHAVQSPHPTSPTSPPLPSHLLAVSPPALDFDSIDFDQEIRQAEWELEVVSRNKQ